MLEWMKNLGGKLRKHKKEWVGLLLLIVIIIILVLPYINVVEKAAKGMFIIANNETRDDSTGVLLNTTEVCQTVYSSRNQILGIALNFGTFQNTITCDVVVKVVEHSNGVLVEQWNVNARELQDLQYKSFQFANPIVDGKNKTYDIVITSPNGTIENGVTVLKSRTNEYKSGKLWINKVEIKGDINFQLLGQSAFLNDGYIYMSVLIVLVFLLLYYGMFYKQWKIHYIFAVMVFLIGGMYLIIFTPYSAPDESAHIATAYYNANILLGQPALDDKGHVLVREDDLELSQKDKQPSKYLYNVVYDRIIKDEVDIDRVSYGRGPLSVPIMAHLPQTIGIIIGWSLGLSGILTLYVAKLMALLFYATCCYVAIKKIPFGKMIIFIVALLPMTMELATSCSYDSTVNALCFLFIGYCFYLAYEKEKIMWYDVGGLSITAIAMVPSKVVYLLVCGICLLIPQRKFGKKRYYDCGILLITLSGLVTLLITRLSAIYALLATSAEERSGEITYTLLDILSDIPHAILMFLNSFVMNGEFYLRTMLGGLLGWLELTVSWGVLMGFVVVAVLAIMKKPNEKTVLTIGAKSWLCFLVCVMCSLIFFGLWLDWTALDAPCIEGVQGRYFLPFLPIVLLLFSNETLRLKRNIDYELAITVFCLQVMAVSELIIQVISR